MTKKRCFFDILLIVMFLLGLFGPLISTHNREKSAIEKRRLRALPDWKWEKETIITFPGEFQEWFTDHFGFRDHLAQAYYLLGFALGSSTTPNVIIGKRQWLFHIAPMDGNNLEDYRKHDSLSLTELQQLRTTLEAKYIWLKQHGTLYVFIVAPNKQSIYGEHFPSRVRVVGTQSRFDQFIEYMQGSEVPILDLREPLIQAKKKGRLYYKTDTHWNSFGAAVAQYEIMQAIAKHYPNIHPVSYSAEDFSWNRRKGGDIARLLNLANILKEGSSPVLRQSASECEKRDLPATRSFMTNCSPMAPSILIFRDSFFTALQPYISQYFSKSVYVWEQEPPDFERVKQLSEQYAPHIVIEERAERYLKAVTTSP